MKGILIIVSLLLWFPFGPGAAMQNPKNRTPDIYDPPVSTVWFTARTARVDLETYVQESAFALQQQYASLHGDNALEQSSFVNMCDTSGWLGNATESSQFLSSKGSCSIFDVDENGLFTDHVLTGRRHSGIAGEAYITHEECVYEEYEVYRHGNRVVGGDGNADEDDDGSYEILPNAFVDTEDYLISTKCISNTTEYDKGACSIRNDIIGAHWPAWDYRIGIGEKDENTKTLEILASDGILERIMSHTNAYPQMGWTFMGFQGSGLYRSYPALYQCRNRHQCAGCDDPRRSPWYIDTVMPLSKKVVVVLEVWAFDGSLSKTNILDAALIRNVVTAITILVDSLSERDYFGVVWEYKARCRTLYNESLVPVTAANKARLKAFLHSRPGTVNTARHELLLSYVSVGKLLRDTPPCRNDTHLILVRNREVQRTDIGLKNLNLEGVKVHGVALTNFDADSMWSLACNSQGTFRQVIKPDAESIAEALTSFFVAEGMLGIKTTEDDLPPIHWFGPYHDGQGRGRALAACSPMHFYGNAYPSLLGVFCASIWESKWEALSGYAEEWQNITASKEQADGICHSLSIEPHHLEWIREHISCEAGCNKDHAECKDLHNLTSVFLVIIVIVGALALTALIVRFGDAWYKHARSFRQKIVASKKILAFNKEWADANTTDMHDDDCLDNAWDIRPKKHGYPHA